MLRREYVCVSNRMVMHCQCNFRETNINSSANTQINLRLSNVGGAVLWLTCFFFLSARFVSGTCARFVT